MFLIVHSDRQGLTCHPYFLTEYYQKLFSLFLSAIHRTHTDSSSQVDSSVDIEVRKISHILNFYCCKNHMYTWIPIFCSLQLFQIELEKQIHDTIITKLDSNYKQTYFRIFLEGAKICHMFHISRVSLSPAG